MLAAILCILSFSSSDSNVYTPFAIDENTVDAKDLQLVDTIL